MPLFHPRKCPLSTANEVIPLGLLFLPRTVVRINKQAFAKHFVILWVKGLYKGETLPLIDLVLATRSDRSCMRLLGCKWVQYVMSTEGGSCLHSPTMPSTRSISHIFGIEAWLGMLTGMNLRVDDGQLGSMACSGLTKSVSLGFARWKEIHLLLVLWVWWQTGGAFKEWGREKNSKETDFYPKYQFQ